MNDPKPQQVPALKIVYFDSIDRNLIQAYVYREGARMKAHCTAEDIRIYLQNLVDTASSKVDDNDLEMLQSLDSHLSSGINRYSRREYLIIPRRDVKSYE